MTPAKNPVQRGIPCCSGKKVSAFVVRSVVCVVVLYMGDGHDPYKKIL